MKQSNRLKKSSTKKARINRNIQAPVSYHPVIICTAHRGVFYAEIDTRADKTQRALTNLKNCRMAIYWGTTKGVMQLAHTGPTDKSRISAPANIECLQDVTAVLNVTAEATAKWKSL